MPVGRPLQPRFDRVVVRDLAKFAAIRVNQKHLVWLGAFHSLVHRLGGESQCFAVRRGSHFADPERALSDRLGAGRQHGRFLFLFLFLFLRLAAFPVFRFFRRRNGEGALYRLRHIYFQQHVAPVLLAPADHVLPLCLLLLFLLGRQRSRYREVQTGPVRRPGERMHLELFCVERQGLAAGHRNDPNPAGLLGGARGLSIFIGVVAGAAAGRCRKRSICRPGSTADSPRFRRG